MGILRPHILGMERSHPFSGMSIVDDTEIIHQLLQQDPKATIGYAPQAQVVHAEVRHFGQYLYKLFECEQYSETYSKRGPYCLYILDLDKGSRCSKPALSIANMTPVWFLRLQEPC
jgi:hypothetical protein